MTGTRFAYPHSDRRICRRVARAPAGTDCTHARRARREPPPNLPFASQPVPTGPQAAAVHAPFVVVDGAVLGEVPVLAARPAQQDDGRRASLIVHQHEVVHHAAVGQRRGLLGQLRARGWELEVVLDAVAVVLAGHDCHGLVTASSRPVLDTGLHGGGQQAAARAGPPRSPRPLRALCCALFGSGRAIDRDPPPPPPRLLPPP